LHKQDSIELRSSEQKAKALATATPPWPTIKLVNFVPCSIEKLLKASYGSYTLRLEAFEPGP